MSSKAAPILPAFARTFLAGRTSDLRRRKIKIMRLTPLLLHKPFAELLARRRRFFATLEFTPQDYGGTVTFVRKVRPTAAHPHGRTVEGGFQVLAVSDVLHLMASSLDLDAHKNGPTLLARRAYPVAERPFIPSTLLRRLIEKMSETTQWTAVCLDAIGYDRKTRRFRRDMKQQSVDVAMAEMSEQSRQLHRVVVSFRDGTCKETLRAALDRYCGASILKGDIESACSGFVFPAVQAVVAQSSSFDVPRALNPSQQMAVQLQFRDDPFEKSEGMDSLCRSMRNGEGLSVTVVHLNPYLQAQVLDFLTGAAVEVVVMDAKTVSLIPRSADCQRTLERISTTVFRYFGEANLSTVRVE